MRLSGQPFQILLVLLESPGKTVSRDQLRERVWGAETFVDFEGGLNAAINKLRRALGASADSPRYIETVTGSGYRFIGTLDASVAETPFSTTSEAPPSRRRFPILFGLIPIAAVALIAFLLFRKSEIRPAAAALLKLTRLTNDEGYADAS